MNAVWQRVTSRSFGRHSHSYAYAAVLLAGGYREVGDAGIIDVRPGDVVVHGEFEAHANQFGARGAWILDLPIPLASSVANGFGRVDDLDRVVRMAEKSERDAVEALLATFVPIRRRAEGVAEELVSDLIDDPSLSIGAWATAHGIRPWQLSSEFVGEVGITAVEFRVRSRTLKALKSVRRTDLPLSRICQECGFADQAHMTRSVTALTGQSPGSWRKQSRIRELIRSAN